MWTEEEDSLLVQLVKEYGKKAWKQISESIPGRTGKQVGKRARECHITNSVGRGGFIISIHLLKSVSGLQKKMHHFFVFNKS